MRRWLRLGLCLGLLTVALTCSALAATPKYTKDKDGTVDYANGKYTASYTGVTSGNQYALLVVKATKDGAAEPINDDTLMYIDQKGAEGTTISFDFIPKSTPDCVVLLGGVFDGGTGNSPVTLGTLIGQGVTVSGKVTYYNNTPWTVKVEVQDLSGSEIESFPTNGDGTFSVTLPEGSYQFIISADGYLTYTSAITVSAESGEIALDYRACAGDVDASGAINGTDIGYVLSDFNKTDPYYSTDFDHSGAVNGTDLSTALGNFGRTKN